MSFNADQLAVARDVVATLGDSRTIQVVRVTPTTFTGSTAKRAETTSTQTVTGAVGPVETDLFGGRPKRTRYFKVLASDLSWTPDASDRVVFDGTTWQVKQNGVRLHCGGALVRIECSEILAGNP